jgi:hypothetical protein
MSTMVQFPDTVTKNARAAIFQPTVELKFFTDMCCNLQFKVERANT